MRLPLLFLLGCLSGAAFAQPVLNSTYFGSTRTLGVLNDEFTTPPTFNLPEGANQTWNLTLPAGTSNLSLSTAVVTTPPPGAYARTCNFSYILTGPSFTQKEYVRQDVQTGITFLTQAVISPAFTMTTIWPTTSQVFPFKLGFGQSIQQINYRYDSSSLSIVPISYLKRIDTTRYAGFGTLVLNGKTMTNCVLIKSNYINQKAAAANGTYVYLSRHAQELVFAPGVGYPVLVRTYNIDPPSNTEVSYLANVVTDLPPPVHHIALSLYPQPASAQVQVGLPGEGWLIVKDLLGRQVSQVAYAHGVAYVFELPKGFYQVETVADNKFYTAKLVKE